MRQRRLLILVSSSRLEVAVVRGRTVEARRSCPHDSAARRDTWPGSLKTLVEPLRTLVAQVGGAGLPATILYEGPQAAAGVFSCPASAGRKAEQAAMLALADAAGFPLDSNPSEVARLCSDPRAQAGVHGSAQVHFLGAADTDVSASAVATWAAGAGVRPEEIIPITAPVLASAVHEAVALSAQGAVAVLWVGEEESVLVAASAGRLRFVRTVGVGLDSLVAVLTREFRPATAESPAVALDRAAATELLLTRGIPRPGTVFDEARGIAAESVLPPLQPVLQRLVVETKHSLRFGLEEPDRAGARLVLVGPGGTIPRLAQIIAEQIGLTTAEPSPGAEAAGATITPIDAYLAHPWCGLSLRPIQAGRDRAARGAVRSLWIGIGAAAAFVLVQGLRSSFDLAAQRSRLQTLEASLAATARPAEMARRAGETRSAMAALRTRMTTVLGEAPAWHGLLAFLAEDTPPEVRLTELKMSFDAGKPVCRLSGMARAPLPGDPDAIVRHYLESLGSAPIVESARLGGTQRSEAAGFTMQQFQVTLTLVGLPARAVESGIASAGDPPSASAGGAP